MVLTITWHEKKLAPKAHPPLAEKFQFQRLGFRLRLYYGGQESRVEDSIKQ